MEPRSSQAQPPKKFRIMGVSHWCWASLRSLLAPTRAMTQGHTVSLVNGSSFPVTCPPGEPGFLELIPYHVGHCATNECRDFLTPPNFRPSLLLRVSWDPLELHILLSTHSAGCTRQFMYFVRHFNPQIAVLQLIIYLTGWSPETKTIFCSVLLWVRHQDAWAKLGWLWVRVELQNNRLI
jgi:hypothetical protein